MMKIGYAREGYHIISIEDQLDYISQSKCQNYFLDKTTLDLENRDEIWKCIDYLSSGSTLYVYSLSILSTSISNLETTLNSLISKNISLAVKDAGLFSNKDLKRLAENLKLFCRFERHLLSERTSIGIRKARVVSESRGRKPKITLDDARAARKLLLQGAKSKAELASYFQVHRATLNAAIKRLERYEEAKEFSDNDAEKL
ncbi:recombinase family protein [Marinobacter sp. NFXS11]|uniref:recombinase family protein n=1 Tax=Marinobacter sp. NFXS11 TaxID=2818432 RepID=UPI0032DF8E27